MQRYSRQIALPEIGPAGQKKLSAAHIAVIGAGGLGAAALPYLAAAGIGKITIIDHDVVSLPNLHRQTIYQDGEVGHSKTELAANYCRALNPDIEVKFFNQKLTDDNASICEGYDLLLDGSDNFETKTLLNKISIETQTPLITASVNQWAGQCGIFAGYLEDAPCYHCLFPELPNDARNCNEAGILGTSAGLTGTYQAHLTLLYLLGLATTGTVLSLDFKTLRLNTLMLHKDPACSCCAGQNAARPVDDAPALPEILPLESLRAHDHVIVDVRTDPEIAADPIAGALHMEITTIPAHYRELPSDKLLAFVCAGNVRSVQAAQYMRAMGYANVCVLDKFSL